VPPIRGNLGEGGSPPTSVRDSPLEQLTDGRIVDGSEHIYDLDAWDDFWS